MLGFVARRALLAIPTLIGITIVVFVLIRSVPGDPLSYYLSQLGPVSADPEAIERLRTEFGLDGTVASQYQHWLRGVVTLDLGLSLVDRRPVLEKIGEKLPATILLNGVALCTAALLAIPFGVLVARSPATSERINLVLVFVMSIPSFWAGLLLADWLAIRLHVLPLYGMGTTPVERVQHLIIPAFCLTYGQLAFLTRLTSSAVREQILQQHATAARARGVGESTIAWRYGLRPAAHTIISVLSLMLPAALSGSVIIERLFAWDGIGRLYFDAVASRDYPVVMGLTLSTAVLVLLVNIITDVLYRLVDPRLEPEVEE